MAVRVTMFRGKLLFLTENYTGPEEKFDIRYSIRMTA
jgi:hypothetical protein